VANSTLSATAGTPAVGTKTPGATPTKKAATKAQSIPAVKSAGASKAAKASKPTTELPATEQPAVVALKSVALKGKASNSAAPAPQDKPSDEKPTSAKTAANRSVAAAFVAARQKMAPAPTPTPSVNKGTDAVKGLVEVAEKLADKKVKKTTDEQDSVSAAVNESPIQPVATPVVAARPSAVAQGDRTLAKVAKPVAPKGQGFKTHEFIVYPAHGVGQIVAIEEQEVAGYKLELFVISFAKDKMILKVPLPKIVSVGMRKLADEPVVKRALDTLTGRARIKRTMWSRRAQEYEAKINSGDLVAIAEVVRDLYRSDAQPEQSYSERQLYEAALDRMAREIAAVQKLTDSEALKVIDDQLQKGPRRVKAEEVDEAEDADETDSGIVEAA
jgi:CarD family transcriptional regulator